jgi:hypothetical protein
MKRLTWQNKKDRYGFPYYIMSTPLDDLIVEPWTDNCNGKFYGSPMPYDMKNNTPLIWTYNKCASRFKDPESAKSEAFRVYKEKVAKTLEGLK